MSELDLEIRQLVDATRYANRPTDADCERVLEGLQARLGITVGVLDLEPKGFSRLLAPKVAAKSAMGLALVVAGSALFYSMSKGSVTDRGVSVGTPIVSASMPSEFAVDKVETRQQNIHQPDATAAPTENQSAAAASVGSTRRINRPPDSLSEEVAILSRAEQELHSGRAESALRLLNEHERKYRKGALSEERTAARIQALCAVGRVTEANALLDRLSPNSLHGEPTRQACTSTKSTSTPK